MWFHSADVENSDFYLVSFFFFNPIFTMCLFVHTPTHAFTSVLSSSLFILILLLYLSRIYTDPIGLLYLILFLHKLTFLGPTGGGGCSHFNTFTCDTFARNVCVIVEGNICCRPLFMGFYRPKKALKSKVYLLSTFFFFPFGVCVTVSTDNPLEYTHSNSHLALLLLGKSRFSFALHLFYREMASKDHQIRSTSLRLILAKLSAQKCTETTKSNTVWSGRKSNQINRNKTKSSVINLLQIGKKNLGPGSKRDVEV